MEHIACSSGDCRNPARRRGMCWTHLKREKRGIPAWRAVRPYRMSSKERLARAASRFAEAETEQEYFRARDLLGKYATRG